MIAAACGCRTGFGGGDLDGAVPDANVDGGRDNSKCRSAQGFAICGGPDHCPPQPPECGCYDLRVWTGEANDLALCGNDAYIRFTHDYFQSGTKTCQGCGDGHVCVQPTVEYSIYYCAPWEVGELYRGAGGQHRVRYPDLSLWTGEPIPATAPSCPSPGPIRYCGGGCGTCLPDENCIGLSPLHPVGFCRQKNQGWASCDIVNSTPKVSCASGGSPTDACFTFKVQPETQMLADQYGYCFPPATCDVLAAALGGKCTPP